MQCTCIQILHVSASDGTNRNLVPYCTPSRVVHGIWNLTHDSVCEEAQYQVGILGPCLYYFTTLKLFVASPRFGCAQEQGALPTQVATTPSTPRITILGYQVRRVCCCSRP